MPRGDTLYIMYYPPADTLDFVPGYYVSTTDWQQAARIIPLQNLNNTNGLVDRINNSQNPYAISGQAFLNGSSDAAPAPLKNAIIYVLQGSVYKNFGITNSNGIYTAANLGPGIYTLTAQRLGFAPVTQNVTITNSNLQNINFNFGNPIGIEVISSEVPQRFSLSQNYPNPFNPVTYIEFEIIYPGLVRLEIFDILGRKTASLIDNELRPGKYRADWLAADHPSGIYFYRLISGSVTETKKMMLVK